MKIGGEEENNLLMWVYFNTTQHNTTQLQMKRQRKRGERRIWASNSCWWVWGIGHGRPSIHPCYMFLHSKYHIDLHQHACLHGYHPCRHVDVVQSYWLCRSTNSRLCKVCHLQTATPIQSWQPSWVFMPIQIMRHEPIQIMYKCI